MEYRVPKELLGFQNYKTIKGEKRGWKTYIMYLSPHKANSRGVNLCPKASKGCAKACLFNSGNARFKKVTDARLNKTEYFLSDLQGYMLQLDKELTKNKNKHFKTGDRNFAVRLNGTTDFRFENLKVKDGKNIFELHPDVQFYDYTKIAKRLGKTLPKNYHLTFSRSEDNHEEVVEVLNNGGNVAVVFDKLPETYLGFPVINGDNDDLRFLDEENVVVGLTYKVNSVEGGKENNAYALETGFVVEVDKLTEVEIMGEIRLKVA